MRYRQRSVCMDSSDRVFINQDLHAERCAAVASVAFVVSQAVVAVVRVFEVGGICLASAERACDLQEGVMISHDL